MLQTRGGHHAAVWWSAHSGRSSPGPWHEEPAPRQRRTADSLLALPPCFSSDGGMRKPDEGGSGEAGCRGRKGRCWVELMESPDRRCAALCSAGTPSSPTDSTASVTHPHAIYAWKGASQLHVYLPIVTLQQQQVRGLVKRVPHPSSALTALVFSETIRGLALSTPNGSWQRGVKTLGLISHSQLQKQAFQFGHRYFENGFLKE